LIGLKSLVEGVLATVLPTLGTVCETTLLH
jgi:hypothetical protein